MNLSPQDRAMVCRLAAERVVEELRKSVDLSELITLPLAVVGQMVGLGPVAVKRAMAPRRMGSKLGVSLRVLQDYQSKEVKP